MKLFQRLSIVYLAMALISASLALSNIQGELFMILLIGTITVGSVHGFIACIQEYKTRYLPHLIAFSLILLTVLFALAIIMELIATSGWDAIGYLIISGIVILALIALLVLYSVGLWIYGRIKK